jgi:hypothetical protein
MDQMILGACSNFDFWAVAAPKSKFDKNLNVFSR